MFTYLDKSVSVPTLFTHARYHTPQSAIASTFYQNGHNFILVLWFCLSPTLCNAVCHVEYVGKQPLFCPMQWKQIVLCAGSEATISYKCLKFLSSFLARAWFALFLHQDQPPTTISFVGEITELIGWIMKPTSAKVLAVCSTVKGVSPLNLDIIRMSLIYYCNPHFSKKWKWCLQQFCKTFRSWG